MTTRPPECCGVCPPLLRGGYDCTCKDNARCPKSDWHSFFAYWPIRTPGGWTWLHWVERRMVTDVHHDYYGDGRTLYVTRWEYRRKA